jgi:hypothetical protein
MTPEKAQELAAETTSLLVERSEESAGIGFYTNADLRFYRDTLAALLLQVAQDARREGLLLAARDQCETCALGWTVRPTGSRQFSRGLESEPCQMYEHVVPEDARDCPLPPGDTFQCEASPIWAAIEREASLPGPAAPEQKEKAR